MKKLELYNVDPIMFFRDRRNVFLSLVQNGLAYVEFTRPLTLLPVGEPPHTQVFLIQHGAFGLRDWLMSEPDLAKLSLPQWLIRNYLGVMFAAPDEFGALQILVDTGYVTTTQQQAKDILAQLSKDKPQQGKDDGEEDADIAEE